ncbi:hypothetical protein LT493_12350 [Streptomyces tricolor]|nr:hypothetical protein [Streptomyces tricolor]
MTGPIHVYDRYDEPDQLRDQLRRLLRHRAVIALRIVLGLLGGAALAFSRAHTYTSTSEVLVRSTADPFGTVSVAADNQVSTGHRAADRRQRRGRRPRGPPHGPGRRHGGHARQGPADHPPGEVAGAALRVHRRTPGRAARGANAFAEAYLADRKARNEAAVQRAGRSVQQQIKAVQAAKEKDEDEAVDKAVQSELDTLHKRIVEINSRDTVGGDIVRRGEAPARPSGPGWAVLLTLGLASGLAPRRPAGLAALRPRQPGPVGRRGPGQRCARRCSACCRPSPTRTPPC